MQSPGKALHGECNMMNPFPPLLNEFRDRSIRCRGGKKLDLGRSHLEECGLHLLVRDLFDGVTRSAQQLFIELDRLVEVFHCDADVLDVCRFHVCHNMICSLCSPKTLRSVSQISPTLA